MDKPSACVDAHSRHVLFLDKTRLPYFYAAPEQRVPFTLADLELWLRRLRVLYQIEKGRAYGEVIDCVLSVLQFVPAAVLADVLHVTPETCVIDELILNDIARARMHMLEDWATDGESYRPVKLTDAYRLLLLSSGHESSTEKMNDEQLRSQETAFVSADLDTSTLGGFQFSLIDSD